VSQPKNIVVEFENKYGDKQVIHKTRRGLQLRRRQSTVCLTLTKAVGPLVGERIRAARIAAGLTLAELCSRAGIVSSNPKSRMWEIEVGVRREGIHLGTLYAIALALDVPVQKLMPTAQEAMANAPIQICERLEKGLAVITESAAMRHLVAGRLA
jgi:transcriptional regulator with XRE-family HTH domain